MVTTHFQKCNKTKQDKESSTDPTLSRQLTFSFYTYCCLYDFSASLFFNHHQVYSVRWEKKGNSFLPGKNFKRKDGNEKWSQTTANIERD